MLSKMQMSSPTGELVAVARGTKLACLVFANHWSNERSALERRFGALSFEEKFPRPLESSLAAYFEGDVHAIDDLEVDVGGTFFQMNVWKALRTIPAGETISYQELARRAGAPRATRAAGNANGRNPVSIVIPCHRVVRADGSIGGYGGGVPRKRWLLDHEQKHARPAARRAS
jgi:methylated-DNA-[protein]-cysteine S-methyltransferase